MSIWMELVCDICSAQAEGRHYPVQVGAMRRFAFRNGWRRIKGKDLCPCCAGTHKVTERYSRGLYCNRCYRDNKKPLDEI